MASKGLEAKTHIYDNIIHTPTLIWADLQCMQRIYNRDICTKKKDEL